MRQVQYQMQKLIGRAEDLCFQPARQTAGCRPAKELVHGNTQSLVTEPKVQFEPGPGRVGKRDVMAYRYSFIYWCVQTEADFHESVAGAFKIVLRHSQIQIHRRPPKKRGGVIALREQGTFQRYDRDFFVCEKAQHEFQVVKHPLMAYPALGQNSVAPEALRWGDVRAYGARHQRRHTVATGVFLNSVPGYVVL